MPVTCLVRGPQASDRLLAAARRNRVDLQAHLTARQWLWAPHGSSGVWLGHPLPGSGALLSSCAVYLVPLVGMEFSPEVGTRRVSVL